MVEQIVRQRGADATVAAAADVAPGIIAAGVVRPAGIAVRGAGRIVPLFFSKVQARSFSKAMNSCHAA